MSNKFNVYLASVNKQKHKKICVTIKVNEEQKEDDEETNTNNNLPLKQVCTKDVQCF